MRFGGLSLPLSEGETAVAASRRVTRRGAQESQREAAGSTLFSWNQTRNRIFNAEAAAGREAGGRRQERLPEAAAGKASLIQAGARPLEVPPPCTPDRFPFRKQTQVGPVLGFPSVWRLVITISIFQQDCTSSSPALSSQLTAAGGRHAALCVGPLEDTQSSARGTPLREVSSWRNEKSQDHRPVRQRFLFGMQRGLGRVAWPWRGGKRGAFTELHLCHFRCRSCLSSIRSHVSAAKLKWMIIIDNRKLPVKCNKAVGSAILKQTHM